MSKDTNLLTTEQAAEKLGLKPDTLQTYRTRGGGPRFRKIGRWVRYTPEDLQAWLDKCGRDSTSDGGSRSGGKRGKCGKCGKCGKRRRGK